MVDSKRFNGDVAFNGTVDGVSGIVHSAATSLICTGATNADFVLKQPANSILLDAGVVLTTAIVINSAANVAVTVGTAAGGEQICASANLMSSATAGAIGSAITVSGASGEGAASLAFVADSAVHVAADRDVHIRVANSANNITAGEARAFIRYIKLTD